MGAGAPVPTPRYAPSRLADLRTRQGRSRRPKRSSTGWTRGRSATRRRHWPRWPSLGASWGGRVVSFEAELDDMAAVSRARFPCSHCSSRCISPRAQSTPPGTPREPDRDLCRLPGQRLPPGSRITSPTDGSASQPAITEQPPGQLPRRRRQLRPAQLPPRVGHRPPRARPGRGRGRRRPSCPARRGSPSTEFAGLGATWRLDATASLLRSLGVKTASPRSTAGDLTSREAEVYDLLALGLVEPGDRRPGSTSAARRSNTTWATCSPSSVSAAGPRSRPTPPAWGRTRNRDRDTGTSPIPATPQRVRLGS